MTQIGFGKPEWIVRGGIRIAVCRGFMILATLTLFSSSSAFAQSMGYAYVYKDAYLSGGNIAGFTSISDSSNSYRHQYWIENVTLKSIGTGRSVSATSNRTSMYDSNAYVRQDVFLPMLDSDLGDYSLTASPYYLCSYGGYYGSGFTPFPFPPIILNFTFAVSIVCYQFQGFFGPPPYQLIYSVVPDCLFKTSCGNTTIYASAFAGNRATVAFPFIRLQGTTTAICSPLIEGLGITPNPLCNGSTCTDLSVNLP